MPRFPRSARILAFIIVASVPFVPDLQPPVERDLDLDIELVRAAEVRYRGITGTFDELTQAYALTAYDDAELIEWEAQPNPQNPETETLVTGHYRVSGVRAEADTILRAQALRAGVDDRLSVTWQLSTLSSVQVTPADDFARDALTTLRNTIDDYLTSMVLLIDDQPLRGSAGGTDSLGLAQQGEILLRQQQVAGWSQVRVPTHQLTAWLPDSVLTTLHPQ